MRTIMTFSDGRVEFSIIFEFCLKVMTTKTIDRAARINEEMLKARLILSLKSIISLLS